MDIWATGASRSREKYHLRLNKVGQDDITTDDSQEPTFTQKYNEKYTTILYKVAGPRNVLCQRFSACFVLKIAPERREGEKWE